MSGSEESEEGKPKKTLNSETSQGTGESTDSNVICIKVRHQDGTEMGFRVRKTSSLKKMMSVYCQKKQLDQGAIRFTMDGERITQGSFVNYDSTPEDLELEDGDVLEVFSHQEGGTPVS